MKSFNFSADGNYEVTLMTKATVYYDGRVIWEVKRCRERMFMKYLYFLATSNIQIKLYNQCGILSIRLV
jgi:hypothetical protein